MDILLFFCVTGNFFFFNWLLPPVMRPSMFNANKTTVLEGEVLLEGFMCLHTFEQF